MIGVKWLDMIGQPQEKMSTSRDLSNKDRDLYYHHVDRMGLVDNDDWMVGSSSEGPTKSCFFVLNQQTYCFKLFQQR